MQRPRGPAKAASGGGGDEAALTVSQVTEKIKQVLSAGMPAGLLVRGQVSNFNRNQASGHFYFTLKDADSCLDCVMFRSDASRLKFEPDDGMELLANGRVGVFSPRGRYQLYVNNLRPLGQGALELAFRQVRAKLEAEGLFAAQRKKPLAGYPLRIVIITSREAAALQDVLKILRRFPWLRIMLYSVPVQGEDAAEKIAAAIAHVNAGIGRVGGSDVILLARGGGSLEDLWPFNEESVARAIAASRIPIVTGIGHEVDVSIADLIADYHAHTPTEAAQVITAQWRNAGQLLDSSSQRLGRATNMVMTAARQQLAMIQRHEAFRRPTDRINMLRQLVDDYQRAMIAGQDRILRQMNDRVQIARGSLERYLPRILYRFAQLLGEGRRRLEQVFIQRLRLSRDRLAGADGLLQRHHPRLKVQLGAQELKVAQVGLSRALRQNQRMASARLQAVARQLEAISPRAVLRRGYSITSRKREGIPLRSATQLKPGDKILTRFADGQAESTVEDSRQLSLFE